MKPHKCDHENYDKSFKNASSLHKHQLVYDEIKRADCDYLTYDLRNLSAHLIAHTNKKRYGCEKCGKGFIYHTQMVRHITGKKCEALKDNN